MKEKTFKSDISQKTYNVTELVKGSTIREPLFKLILEEHPDFTDDSNISISELNKYREKYISKYLFNENKVLTKLETQVLETISNSESISSKLQESQEVETSFGAKIADKVAAFGGSWTFIIIFISFILVWITFNVVWLANKGFDPYPFILLNLILSCIAAIQAPVIMMSQNRQEEKDRDRAQNDYMVNLKSELEIRTLHEKMDHLMINQQQELIEIQKVQIEMLNDIIQKLKV
ncbi:MAG: DUF1003 domain-containing protein [Cytophagales bacterium]